MLLPGRVPGYKNTDAKLLPSSTTKKINLGALPPSSGGKFNESGRLLHVHESMATTPPKHRGDEADDRPLLGVSTE